MNSDHSQTWGLERMKAIGQGWPTAVAISNLSLDLLVVPDLTPDVLGEDQVWALSIIQPLLGCVLVMEINLDYEN